MPCNLLIVDDSPAMRRVVRRSLDVSGLAVDEYFEAGDGCEALTLLRRERVDLILTDVNMPAMDGEQLLVELRNDRTLARIPVLIVSTDQSEIRMRRMMALGAMAYVSKPFQPANLSAAIHRLLGGLPHADF